MQRQAADLRTPARWATITIKGEHTGLKHGNETLQPGTFELLIAYRIQQLGQNAMSVFCHFSPEPPFLLRRVSYMRNLPPERAENLRRELAWMMAAVSYSKIAI